MFSVRIILHLRGSNFKNWLESSSNLTQCYVTFILKLVHGVVVLGNNLSYLFADYFSLDKIFVVPNGANYDFSLESKDNEIPRLLYLSNLQPSKGIEDVIAAVQILKNTNQKKYILEVVGAWRDESVKEQCLKVCQNGGLPVEFYPPANWHEKKRLLERADVFIFTPRAPEGHPWVIVEAMAAGLPIIATNQGAIIESVMDGINGFIVDAYSPSQIAEKIAYLMDHPDTRRKMGQASYQHYLKNFTEKSMVDRLVKCFNKVLS